EDIGEGQFKGKFEYDFFDYLDYCTKGTATMLLEDARELRDVIVADDSDLADRIADAEIYMDNTADDVLKIKLKVKSDENIRFQFIFIFVFEADILTGWKISGEGNSDLGNDGIEVSKVTAYNKKTDKKVSLPSDLDAYPANCYLQFNYPD
ncbi:MAG: hypothetical protein FWE62_00455, partial [Firmicutes bacterium]|nr:hypothetical protein [Bacillota bacterium]